MVDRAAWDQTYRTRPARERSWTESVPTASLARISAIPHRLNDPIVDIGGGASMLVDELTAGGHCDVTVLDVSPAALDEAKQRGFADDTRVSWVVADVLAWKPTRHYAIWHDRAVFHFLVEPRDRALYVEQAASAIRPGGHLTVATFAADGPTECSGFAVCRYQPYELESIFSGDSFAPSSTGSFVHETPWLGHQPFTWVTLVRRP